MLGRLVLLAVLGATALSAQEPPRHRATARPPFLATTLFAFHSEPETNLHHFLYRWATVAPPGGAEGRGRALALATTDRDRLAALSDDELESWRAALVYYRDHLIDRSLLFDRELVAIRDALSGKVERDRVGEVDRQVFAHLDRCLSIYLRQWWSEHDRANREWTVAVVPWLVRHEQAIAARIAAAYQATWPSPPNRVDVAAYSNRTSAYTTSEAHATIASTEPQLVPPWSLEILFHEHSHSDALERPLVDTVDAAFVRRQLRAPDDLWHILLFATAGEATRAVLVAAGEADYQPYAWRNQVFHRGDVNRRAWQAVEQHWLPALAKGKPLSGVIDAIAADLAPLLEGAGEARR